jgi:hypothetical protein
MTSCVGSAQTVLVTVASVIAVASTAQFFTNEFWQKPRLSSYPLFNTFCVHVCQIFENFMFKIEIAFFSGLNKNKFSVNHF